MLLQARGWTAVGVISLAFAIGANTALFSAVNALLLRELAVHEPDTLVRLRWAGKNDMVTSSSGYGFSGKDASGGDIRSTSRPCAPSAMRGLPAGETCRASRSDGRAPL